MNSFRPPRFRTEKGTRTDSVEGRAGSHVRPRVDAELAHEADEPVGAKPDVEPVLSDFGPLDKQLDDARLLAREELFPERIEGSKMDRTTFASTFRHDLAVAPRSLRNEAAHPHALFCGKPRPCRGCA